MANQSNNLITKSSLLSKIEQNIAQIDLLIPRVRELLRSRYRNVPKVELDMINNGYTEILCDIDLTLNECYAELNPHVFINDEGDIVTIDNHGQSG